MKIVHIHLLGPYTDGWGYQENILPAVQARQGHEVIVITGCQTHLPDNSITTVQPAEYEIEGVKIVRIQRKKIFGSELLSSVVFDYPIYEQLKKFAPDVILLHGLGRGKTNNAVKRYIKKNPQCILFGDTHVFDGNAERSKSLKTLLWRKFNDYFRKKLFKYYSAVFCISQQCLDYARDVYKVPEDLLKIFPLGYDPAIIHWEKRDQIKKSFREKYNIGDDEIVIVHGGKIIPRRKTSMAVDAVLRLKGKVRLVVFGSIHESIKQEIEEKFSLCDGLIYLGHLSKQEYINVFLASDIALFPGAQSSMWEEAIGCGLPLVLNSTEKKDAIYYDHGGNVVFTSEDTLESFVDVLQQMIETKSYKEMAHIAATEGRSFFSYERIADMMVRRY